MKPDRLDEKIAAYYAEQSPPAASVEKLVDLAGGARATAPSVGGSPGRAVDARFGAVALVAASVLLLIPTYFLGFRAGQARSRAEYAQQAAPPAPAQPVVDQPATASHLNPRLVLVRVHADWCPRCPSIAPIFSDLTGRYANEPILCVTLDITTEATRQQSRYLAKSLDVFSLVGVSYDGDRVRMEPGMIRLIDRDKQEVLATLRTIDEQPEFENTLVHALPDGTAHPPTP